MIEIKYIMILFVISFTYPNGLSAQLKVDPSNNFVKIGDIGVSPTARLHITSEANTTFPLRVSSSHGHPLFEVQQGGVGAGNFFIYDSQGNRTVQFAGQGNFFIASSGNVGIDKSAPAFDFEIGEENGGAGEAFKTSGSMWLYPMPFTSNDGATKYQKGLAEILKLQTFQYRVGESQHGSPIVGVSVNELDKIAPEMIVQPKYKLAEDEVNTRIQNKEIDQKFGTVDPSNFLYMLINAVKELNTELLKEKEKNTILESQLNQINNRVARLEKMIKANKL